MYHELVSRLGGDCAVSLTQWELPLQFRLEGGNGAGVVLLLTEHCGGHFDSGHHSDNLLSLSAVVSFISSFNTITVEREETRPSL